MTATSNQVISKHPLTFLELHPGQGAEEMINAALDAVDVAISSAHTLAGPHGEQCVRGQNTELVTLATGAAFTDSTGNLLPANSIIEGVVARVTTAITTAANWSLGDATIATRFSAANSTLIAGTTQVGNKCMDQTGTSGPIQTTAAKLRITCNANPGAGVIRVTVFYRSLVPPTS